MAHVAKWKYDEVKKLTDLFTSKKVVGIVEIGGIPAPQMQQMRSNLREVATIRSAKNSLILRALDEAEKKIKGVTSLKDAITGQTAVIGTDMNPFKLYSKIKSARTMAPAKGGEIATHNIEVKASDTPFKPGPVVGELQKAGIPAAIREGKVIIKENKLIVSEGEKIPSDVAQMLTRLEILPIEIGMTLHAVFEDGSIFKSDVLDIDIDSLKIEMAQASNNAFNLAVKTAWITKFTVNSLLRKAYHNAFVVALEKGVVNKETVKHLLSKAYSNMLILKNMTS